MHVLMVGVDRSTKGGMWTVAKNYLDSKEFVELTNLKYVPTSITGSIIQRLSFSAKAIKTISKELKSGQYNIVHIHMAERGSVYRKNVVIKIAKKYGCKIVLHLHGAEFESWYESSSDRNKAFVRSVLNKADKLIILGHYWERFIGSLIYDQQKIQVIYNAISVPDTNLYNESAQNLLFLGVVGHRKGIDDLLQAMQIVKEKNDKDVKLFVYGPDYDYKINNKIHEYYLEDRVEYCGWLTQDDKITVFNQTALNILPSYNEGLPMTILETMAYGIPNISTNIAAIPEAVNDNNGIVLQPGDIIGIANSILDLMKDNEKRKMKSNNSYESAKNDFSIDKHIAQVIEVYNGLGKEQNVSN